MQVNMKRVTCLEDGSYHYFNAKTPYQALEKMKYYLDLSHRDENSVINKTETGSYLWMEHTGKTYAIEL